MPDRDVTETLVGFAYVLRSAGVPASPDRVHLLLDAVDRLDVTRRRDVYWSGRLTLCAGPDDVAVYNRSFAAYFGGEQAGTRPASQPVVVPRPVPIPAAGRETGADQPLEQPAEAAAASRAEILRHRDLGRLEGDERAAVRRLIALLDPTGPTRRSRRRHPSSRGTIDPGRTVREMLRRGGEPARLHHRARVDRPRRLVLVIDVSGSMQTYADAYLRFAHAAARRRAGTEVFTLGTRLTRVSREIRARDADVALQAVAGAVPDWSGGTRLGELVKAFLDRWGQRGTARGAVVVVFSDGWERGDATLLGEQMARLRRLAHHVVWVNPHQGKPGFAPLTAGIVAAAPHVDRFVEGHSTAALEELAAALSGSLVGERVRSAARSGASPGARRA